LRIWPRCFPSLFWLRDLYLTLALQWTGCVCAGCVYPHRISLSASPGCEMPAFGRQGVRKKISELKVVNPA
jgi:hypothetical protein